MFVAVAVDLVRRPLSRVRARTRSLLSGAAESQRGANLVEYLLLLTFIAIVVLVVIVAFGGEVSEKYSEASNSLINPGS